MLESLPRVAFRASARPLSKLRSIMLVKTTMELTMALIRLPVSSQLLSLPVSLAELHLLLPTRSLARRQLVPQERRVALLRPVLLRPSRRAPLLRASPLARPSLLPERRARSDDPNYFCTSL